MHSWIPQLHQSASLPGVNNFLCHFWVTKKRLQMFPGLGIILCNTFGVWITFLCSKNWLKTQPFFPCWIWVSEKLMWIEWMKIQSLIWTIILPLGLEFLNMLNSKKKFEQALELKDLSILRWSLPLSQIPPLWKRAQACHGGGAC